MGLANWLALALACFAVTWPIGAWLRHRQRLRSPFPTAPEPPVAHVDDHDHDHGQSCGHVAVPHGDHVDYVHDGQRHAPHAGHYDEH